MDGFYRITFENSYGDAEAWVSPDFLSVSFPGLLLAWARGEIGNVRVYDPNGNELRTEKAPAKEHVTAGTSKSRWVYQEIPPRTAAA